jgi:peptide/nickel transport system substrate-binding protein
MFIGPEGTTNWDAGIGTGPYALERFEPGVSFVGKRYPNFYRDDQGFFDSVELLNIADVTNRSNALRTGAVDVIGQPDTKTAKRLDKLDGFSLVEARGAQHFTTAMRTDTDPFTDNNIRLAVKYGIQRRLTTARIRPRQVEVPSQESGIVGDHARSHH